MDFVRGRGGGGVVVVGRGIMVEDGGEGRRWG